jgi:hypothetical protein
VERGGEKKQGGWNRVRNVIQVFLFLDQNPLRFKYWIFNLEPKKVIQQIWSNISKFWNEIQKKKKSKNQNKKCDE